MRAIIPVAGVGSRLRPHTYTMPKVLLNVGGKPILAHILDNLIKHGIDELTLIVGYLGDQIKEYVVKNYSFKVDFVEQQELLGLGHAIYLSRRTVSKEPILIILGDTIFDFDLDAVLSSKTSALGLKNVEDPRRFGVAEIKDGRIIRLIEKPDQPKSNMAIVGIYYIKTPTLLMDSLSEMIRLNKRTKGEFQLTDALQMMIDKGETITPFTVDGWFDCGKPETLLSTNSYMLDRVNTSIQINSVSIIPPVYISPTSKITNSVIGPYVTIADGVEVDECILKNSIICDGAVVKNALLENSIVGNNAAVRGALKRVNIGDSSELDFT